jgi:hypothetical protein
VDLSITALSVDSATTITTEFPPTMAPGFAILANSVEIRWQKTDSSSPSSTSAPVSSNQSSGLPTSSSNSAASSDVGTAKSSNGLSSGAKAGIGIGVVVVCLGLILGALLCLRRRRRILEPIPHTTTSHGEYAGAGYVVKPELEATTAMHPIEMDERSVPRVHGRSELDASHIPELSTAKT